MWVLGDDLNRLARDLQYVGQRTLRLRVICRLKRKHHIVGRERVTVRKGDVLAERERVMAAVRVRFPALGKPGLDILRQSVHADQLCLGKVGDELGYGVAGGQTVEGARLGADRGEGSTPAHLGVQGQVFSRREGLAGHVGSATRCNRGVTRRRTGS